MRNKFTILLVISYILTFECDAQKIDRKTVVQRHNVTIYKNLEKPVQVGNGEFAYNIDITGMQSFLPHNTMAHWAWHQMPLPKGLALEQYKGVAYNINGRQTNLELEDTLQPELMKWLAANPQPINLARIGLWLTHKDGSKANLSELKNTTQHLDLWTGIVTSNFTFDNVPVQVRTACQPKKDEVGIEITSPLIASNQLKIRIEFPYADDRMFADSVGNFDKINNHSTKLIKGVKNLIFDRKVDDLKYKLQVQSDYQINLLKPTSSAVNPHLYLLKPSSNSVNYTFHFLKENEKATVGLENAFAKSTEGWQQYWNSGAAVDFSECTDSRAFELERRVVLSQYLMKVNNAGSMPPQESGLLKNGWYGKFHFEMLWWHGVHFGLWNRWSDLEKMLGIYKKFLPTSISRAQKQGFKGARWPKSTGNVDREWPFVIHAFLVWQQPHPIYFAELDYRIHKSKATLDKWKDIVFATADFMASYPTYDTKTKTYNMNAPIYIMSENTNHDSTNNPAFELSYWRYGLRTAIEWRKRLQMPANPAWDSVLSNLAPLPVQEGKYVTHEGIKDMWTKYNYEHPGLIATYGMLPGDGVDTVTLRKTFTEVLKTWNFDRVWGWDFPVFAMAAARLNNPETAVDMLLHASSQFNFDTLGYNSWVYFPGNGGLLSAIAMMAGGWDGAPKITAPGFPKNGKWNVKVEGFQPME